MALRTLQQHGLGFGSVDTVITASINGAVYFNGPVTTVNEPFPPLPNSGYQVDNVLFDWTVPDDFEGTQQLEISVTGSPLLLAYTVANTPDTPDAFGLFYSVDINGVEYTDPFTNEAIDGVAQSGPYKPELAGQWWWKIPAGSTFTATVNISLPPPPPPIVP
jgi:hypothetical protein